MQKLPKPEVIHRHIIPETAGTLLIDLDPSSEPKTVDHLLRWPVVAWLVEVLCDPAGGNPGVTGRHTVVETTPVICTGLPSYWCLQLPDGRFTRPYHDPEVYETLQEAQTAAYDQWQYRLTKFRKGGEQQSA